MRHRAAQGLDDRIGRQDQTPDEKIDRQAAGNQTYALLVAACPRTNWRITLT